MADLYDGTGAALVEFFNWAAKKGEISKPTANNFRSAVQRVLAIEEEPDAVDVKGLDVDKQLERFQRLTAADFSTSSMAAYKQRFKSAVEIYRAFLVGDDWTKKAPSGTPRGVKATKATKATSSKAAATAAPVETPVSPVATTAGAVMIEYPFPLRPGVRARLILPEILKKSEAQRLAAFIGTLAAEEQLAITAGPPKDEPTE